MPCLDLDPRPDCCLPSWNLPSLGAQTPNWPVRVHLVQMNSGARVVNSALVCTQKGRRDGNSNCDCDRERKRREEDLPPRSLPSNSLVIFISFYWLIFNTIYFIFDFVSSFIILALFVMVMVMAISIHLTDI